MPDEDIFNDLPDGGDEPVAPGGDPPKEPTPEEKQREEEKLRNLKIASKKEDVRIAKLEKDLAEKREKAKQLKAQAVAPAADEPVEPLKASPEDVIKKTVEATLQERESKQKERETMAKIREIAKTRQEAEQIKAEADKFPTDWSVEDRVLFAKQRVQVLRERSRGFVAPSVDGMSGFEDLDVRNPQEEVPGVSQSRIETLKRLGWTVEEIKKFKDGPDLGRVWGENKILYNSKIG